MQDTSDRSIEALPLPIAKMFTMSITSCRVVNQEGNTFLIYCNYGYMRLYVIMNHTISKQRFTQRLVTFYLFNATIGDCKSNFSRQ